jgi:hypothetical protein
MRTEGVKRKPKPLAPTGAELNADELEEWRLTLMCGWGPVTSPEQLEQLRKYTDPYYVEGD